MDIRSVIFDTDLLRRMCADAADAILLLPPQTPVFGDAPLPVQADPGPTAAELRRLASNPDTPTWELQWTCLGLIYLSDSLVAALEAGTPANVFRAWHTGMPGATALPFRRRFEQAIGGRYSPKRKRGSRKTVEVVAKTCLEVVVDEVMFVHLISGLASSSAN